MYDILTKKLVEQKAKMFNELSIADQEKFFFILQGWKMKELDLHRHIEERSFDLPTKKEATE
ncbi:MAG: hypothetical protein FWG65_11860 [Turicibacter sp.]|nr:hypothetical protein [Turicibacter sp.]